MLLDFLSFLSRLIDFTFFGYIYLLTTCPPSIKPPTPPSGIGLLHLQPPAMIEPFQVGLLRFDKAWIDRVR